VCSRWKHDLDDEDRANLSHLSRIADILNNHCPPDVIAWNKALDEVSEKPKAKKKPKSRHSRRKKDG
jgi:hypothetical protein